MEQVAILIPNYKTPLLTKLCLRSIRKYTDLSRVKILVIDNGSGAGEESLEYLRSLNWITLVEDQPDLTLNPGTIHGLSLDKIAKLADAEYILSIHTDTIVIRNDWLDYLLKEISEPGVAGVGSWKLEFHPPLKRFGKRIEDLFRKWVLHPLTGCKIAIAGDSNKKYLRSHCALYRRDLVIGETRGFCDGAEAGRSIHNMLTDKGYKMKFLPETELGKYIMHFDHATMILNPEIGGRKTSRSKARRKISGILGRKCWEEILEDDSLDR